MPLNGGRSSSVVSRTSYDQLITLILERNAIFRKDPLRIQEPLEFLVRPVYKEIVGVLHVKQPRLDSINKMPRSCAPKQQLAVEIMEQIVIK